MPASDPMISLASLRDKMAALLESDAKDVCADYRKTLCKIRATDPAKVDIAAMQSLLAEICSKWHQTHKCLITDTRSLTHRQAVVDRMKAVNNSWLISQLLMSFILKPCAATNRRRLPANPLNVCVVREVAAIEVIIDYLSVRRLCRSSAQQVLPCRVLTEQRVRDVRHEGDRRGH